MPALPGKLDAGTPASCCAAVPTSPRPKQRLHAATARIGVATADLFPRFTLGGLIGSQAIDSSALFERDSETRLVALGIDWSFLDIGRVRARIAAADADAAGELARYQQTVLLALEDTENALVRHAKARVEDQHLQQAATDSARRRDWRACASRPAPPTCSRCSTPSAPTAGAGRARRRPHPQRHQHGRAVQGDGRRLADAGAAARERQRAGLKLYSKAPRYRPRAFVDGGVTGSG